MSLYNLLLIIVKIYLQAHGKTDIIELYFFCYLYHFIQEGIPMKILFFATFREITKVKVLDMSSSDLSDIQQLLTLLIKRFPAFQDELFSDNNQLKPHIHIFVNGRNIIHLKGLSTPITNGDEIALFPPVAGG